MAIQSAVVLHYAKCLFKIIAGVHSESAALCVERVVNVWKYVMRACVCVCVFVRGCVRDESMAECEL